MKTEPIELTFDSDIGAAGVVDRLILYLISEIDVIKGMYSM